MPSILDQWRGIAVYNPDTLSFEMWNGALRTGALTIGTVNQGTAGASAWKVDGSAVTQPVSIASSVPVTGPLTDAQLRATAVPVTTTPSGTQNVDVTANTIGLATGAKQDTGNTSVASIDTKTPALGQALAASSTPVVLTAAQVTTLTPPAAITGFSTETTLAALNTKVTAVNTGAVTISAALPAGTANIGDVDVLTLPSIPSGANVIGALTANQSVNNTQIAGAAITVGNGVTGVGSQRVTLATDSAGQVFGPTLTKATQGATGFSTQDLKDAGRVMVTYTATALAGVTTEALISLTPYRDLTAAGAATTHAVTANKRLRLQSITLSLRSTSTVNVGCLVRFRMLAGTVLVGSPIHNSVGCMSSNLATAVAGNAQSETLTFPDGFELSGTMQFGLTQLCSNVAVTLDVQVTGYEY